MLKSKLIAALKEKKSKAFEDMQESYRIAPNSYGAGADWGIYETLKTLIQELKSDII